MPYVYFDTKKHRHWMFRKVPKELHDILGKKPFTHKFKQSVDLAEANALSIEINLDWEQKIKAAHAKLGKPAPAPWIDLGYVQRLQAMADDARHTYEALTASGERVLSYEEIRAAADEWATAETGLRSVYPEEHAAPKVEHCTTEDTIGFWRTKRGDDQPTQDAITGRRNKMRDFFAWVRENRHPVQGADDLKQVVAEDVQAYKIHLGKKYPPPSNVTRDHLIDIIACFNLANENLVFKRLPDGNPVKDITTPPKLSGAPRPAFTDEMADYIMGEAMKRPDDPVIFYGVPLQRFHGAIISEFADALARHVKLVDGIWCIEFTPEGRTTIVDGQVQKRGLKTQFRHRHAPLHPWFLRNGFVERAQRLLDEYGPNAPLFPEVRPNKYRERRTKASDVMVAFLRGIGIEDKLDPETITIDPKTGKKTGKVVEKYDSYNWRHYLATKLQIVAASTTKERRRFMTGHAGRDVHENIYVEHPPADLKPYIDALPDFFPKVADAAQ